MLPDRDVVALQVQGKDFGSEVVSTSGVARHAEQRRDASSRMMMFDLYSQKVHGTRMVETAEGEVRVRGHGLPDFTNKDWWDNMVSVAYNGDRIRFGGSVGISIGSDQAVRGG